ncbi:class I SAM-dependent methyltransferase [Lentisphaerota bacterium WC36G]|nr:class I SAM-dependent methyltransferase [Lentisphaerae bacterium WC36]
MYNDIVDIYAELFPINMDFINLIEENIKPNSSILDISCGPGHYVNLLSEDYQMMGIDPAQKMIDEARKNYNGEFELFSFEEISYIMKSFDAAYCIGNSISYLENSQLDIFFNELHHLINSSGYFILQVVNWDIYMNTNKFEFPIKLLQNGEKFIREYEKIDDHKVAFHTKLTDGQFTQEWRATMYPKTSEILVEALVRNGFKINKIFGNFNKKPYIADESQAIVIVAQRR